MRIVVVGAGIIGLAVGRELATRGHAVTVLEKESEIARHQTGQNSGVIHAGLYYRPGSLKARLAVAGKRSMVAFAESHGVDVRVCGKLIVATEADALPRLNALAERARANGVDVRMLSAEQAKEYEPAVRCVAALWVDTTGIVDFRAVAEALAADLAERGGELRTDTAVRAIRTRSAHVDVVGGDTVFRADALINCAGLYADRLARMAGLRPSARVVPFRGEYYELRASAEHLVRGLIYPVPDPAFPFLGVHLTRTIDGVVHAGPNAVLALHRQGYRWRDVSLNDIRDIADFPGFWRLAAANLRQGAVEVGRSLSTHAFAASLARMVPEITQGDLVRGGAGVRAQALHRDGSLVDDFLIERAPRQVHVLNAPSPAATSALEIARRIADEL